MKRIRNILAALALVVVAASAAACGGGRECRSDDEYCESYFAPAQGELTDGDAGIR